MDRPKILSKSNTLLLTVNASQIGKPFHMTTDLTH